MRRAARTDENHGAIVNALRALGASVQSLAMVGDDCPDLLVGFRGINLLMEVKPGEAKDKRRRELRPTQAEWFAKWRGQVVKVDSVDSAIAALRGKEA
jgi:hypothetical protein